MSRGIRTDIGLSHSKKNHGGTASGVQGPDVGGYFAPRNVRKKLIRGKCFGKPLNNIKMVADFIMIGISAKTLGVHSSQMQRLAQMHRVKTGFYEPPDHVIVLGNRKALVVEAYLIEHAPPDAEPERHYRMAGLKQVSGHMPAVLIFGLFHHLYGFAGTVNQQHIAIDKVGIGVAPEVLEVLDNRIRRHHIIRIQGHDVLTSRFLYRQISRARWAAVFLMRTLSIAWAM
jgi:hypothetical protein